MAARYVEFADDTEDALVSGCDGAAIALVERSIVEATRVLGVPPRVLLHGGGADALHAHLKGVHLKGVHLRPALVLEGLARWARTDAAA